MWWLTECSLVKLVGAIYASLKTPGMLGRLGFPAHSQPAALASEEKSPALFKQFEAIDPSGLNLYSLHWPSPSLSDLYGNSKRGLG